MAGNGNKTLIVGSMALAAFLLFHKSAEASGSTDVATSGGALNNPGNIKHETKVYAGEIESPSAVFKSFISLEYGYAAMITKLNSYFRSGYDTLDKIINHWAPASDKNHPEAYVQFIVDHMGDPISPYDIFPIEDDETVLVVIALMSDVEQGPGFTTPAYVWNAAQAAFDIAYS